MVRRDYRPGEWVVNWQQAIEFYNIPKKYQEVTLVSPKIEPRIRLECQKWLESPIKPRPSLYLCGVTGSGKTYVSYCLLRALIVSGEVGHAGSWAIFSRSGDLDSELLAALNAGQEESALRKYQEVPYLFFDDLGTETYSDRLLRQVFSIIDRRVSNELTTIYSSNFRDDLIEKYLGARISSRLAEAQVIEFPKVDFRREK